MQLHFESLMLTNFPLFFPLQQEEKRPLYSIFVDMDAESSCCLLFPFLTITTTTMSSVALLLQFLSWWLHLWHLARFPPPFILVGAQYSNNPSTDWTLSDFRRISNFTVCKDRNSSLMLLNEQGNGLYGTPTGIHSAHFDMSYSVYFTLQFVTPTNVVCRTGSVGAYYLSLVAFNTNRRAQDPNPGQVVWTANPQHPVTENACLHLNDNNLTLVDYHDNIFSPEIVWQISTGATDISLTISFEGNLVLFSNTTDPPYVPLWESFIDPTDTLMVLQVLEKQRTLSLNSSSNSGKYTLALENGRLVFYARIGQLNADGESPYGSPYWVWPDSSIPANDNISFAAFCWDPINELRLYAGSVRSSTASSAYRGMVSPEFCSTIPYNSDTTMQITGLDQSMNATFATFLRLEADGDLRAYTVDNTTYPDSNATWRAFYSVFNSTPCALPLYCGFYGLCVPHGVDNSYCRCNYSDDPKLVFADASDTKSGCDPENGGVAQLWDIHNISNSGQACAIIGNIAACAPKDRACEVEFFQLDNVNYFSLSFTNSYQGVQDSDGCRGKCEQNCSCTAAFWNQSTSSCFLVLGRLGTIQQQQGTMQAFIKYVRITPAPSSPLKLAIIIAPVLAASFLVACIFFIAYWQRRRGAQEMSELQKERLLRSELQKERVFLLSLLDVDCGSTEKFTWKQMHKYTNGFSDFLGGGGFGRVFRGALPDGTAIAVKQLDEHGSQSQGNKEFIAEVSILSRIHHAHLVRLIGFCLEGTHRLLVYEYMENGSLDAWLFQSQVPLEAHTERQHGDMNEKKDKERELLPWKRRYQIALGTAKGLAYLHEECEDRVIHMDLKPQNILLGRNFQAKISDFGMSKRTGREQSSVMTVMRGTPGYLAPEWLLDCAITEKCDVYSFGIVLLEMVSGRKVKDVRAVKQKLKMRPLKESVMSELVDEGLRHGSDGVEETEAVRMVEVALMCVRRDPTKRPAMSRVAWMLEGREEVVQQGVDALDIDDEEDGPQQQQQQKLMREDEEEHVDSLATVVESSSGSIITTTTNNSYSKKNSKKKMKKKYIELSKQHLEL